MIFTWAFKHDEAITAAVLAHAKRTLRGREGVLLLPFEKKYNHRAGIVDDVMLGPDGRIMCLFMVYALRTKQRLNSDPESRQYRPLCNILFGDAK